MTVRSRLFGEPFVRALAVLGAVALTLTLLPAVARGQQDRAQAQQQQDTGDPLRACPVSPPEEDFADREDIPDAHLDNVDCAAFFEIVLGFANDEFRPSIPVRRDQMASFIARTLDAGDVELPAAGEGEDFEDVEAGNPHEDNIRRLEAAGIVRGGPLDRSAGEYGPTLPTRRDQMTSLIVRAGEWAYGQQFDSSDQHFDDVPSGNVHFENVNFAAENGIVLGFDENTFGPGNFTRRDQMASFTVRLLNFLATPAEVEITEQSAETARVGEDIAVTASAWTQYRGDAADAEGGDAGVPAGTDVTFSVEHADDPGVTVPEESQTVQTDENGEASFEFTSSQPGEVTVTASVDGPGGNFAHADGASDSAQKAFTADAPVGNQTFEVTPAGPETNPTDGTREYTADVGDAGEVELALADADNVTVAGDGVVTFSTDDGTADFGTTDADFSEIDGATQPDGTTQRTVDAGDDGTFSFTVEGQGTIESVVPVVFVGDDDDALPVDDDGEPENDFAVGGEKTFADVETLALEPESATNRFATDHTVNATLATGADLSNGDQAVELEGETVEFDVVDLGEVGDFTGCPDAVDVPDAIVAGDLFASGSAETDASGTATFSYTGPDDPSEDDDPDQLHCVYAQWSGGEGSEFEGDSAEGGPALKTWSDDPPEATVLALTPETATNLVGGDHSVTATVEDQYGDPLQGEDVSFDVDDEDTGADVLEGTATTDANGEASFTYSGPGDSRDDLITACVGDVGDCEGETPQDDAVKFWVEEAEAGVYTGAVVGFDLGAQSVDIDGTGDVTGNFRLEYGADDQFTVVCSDGTANLTDMAGFEGALSGGDALTSTYDPDGVSTFTLVDEDDSSGELCG